MSYREEYDGHFEEQEAWEAYEASQPENEFDVYVGAKPREYVVSYAPGTAVPWCDVNGELTEIVRCGDCKHFGGFGDQESHICFFHKTPYLDCRPEGFCSWGERRS